MFYRLFTKAKRIINPFFRKNSYSIQIKFRIVSLSLAPIFWGYLSSERIVCAQKQSQLIDDILEKATVTMQQLVKLLNEQSGQDFVIIVYNKFEKANHPEAFGLQLKAVLQQCKDANVTKVYAITSKDQQYLRQIERRIKNQSAQSNPQSNSRKKKQVIDCYYKSKVYSEAFQLVNTKQYSISQQIKQIKHFQITTNSNTLNAQILALHSFPFDINKNIVVKQCRGKGECVESFKQSVKKLIDSGLLIRKTDQYQFELVIDYPSGLLSKPSEYIKNFESCMSKVANRPIKHRKEETYLFNRDILGKEVRLMSEWAQREENNYDDESLLMMFIRPRINIISKLNTLTDLQWYFLTNRLSRAVSLSVNNTDKWKKTNRKSSLQVLKMLQNFYPQLNLLIINSTAAGDIINHVHANHKYVVFSESSNPIWNKKFIDLDQLQRLEGNEERQRVFKQKYKTQLDSFLKKPQTQDLVEVEKQLEISLQRLKQWKYKHSQSQNSLNKHRIVRVCEQRCLHFLNQHTLHQLEEKLNQKLKVYWIDNRTQNVGVKVGDYLLKDGKLYDIAQLLAS